MPLANNPIMSGRSVTSLRHLYHQNLSTGDDFVHSSRMIIQVPFLAPREAVAPFANDPIMSDTLIRSFRLLKDQNSDDFI